MLLPLVLAFAAVAADERVGEGRELREVEILGATLYDRESILSAVRVRPGEPLIREPEAVAMSLEARYHRDGFPAARVAARYDAEAATLSLEVDEGRLHAVEIEGLGRSAARRALRELRLPLGGVLDERTVWDAIERLEAAADGAVVVVAEDPYSVERTGEGARLVLHLRSSPVAARPGGGWPRTAGPFNRVDGFNLGLGGEVDLREGVWYSHLRLAARGFYAFSADTVRFTLGAVWSFGAEQRFALGYQYHDLTDTDDAYRERGLQEARGTALNFTSSSLFFRRLGHEAYTFARLGPGAEAGLSFRSDGYTSLPVVTDDSLLFQKDPIPNPPVEEGRMRSLVATLRWSSPGPLFAGRASEREWHLQPSLYGADVLAPPGFRAELTLERADPALGGDFSFHRLLLRLRGHHGVGLRSALDSRLLLGLTGGDPPAPKRFAIGGLGTLRGYATRALTGRQMALATVEWSFRPGSPWPAVIAFYDGGAVWGDGASARGWKSGSGLGLRWPASGDAFAGVEVGVPWDLAPGEARKVRTLVRLQIPF